MRSGPISPSRSPRPLAGRGLRAARAIWRSRCLAVATLASVWAVGLDVRGASAEVAVTPPAITTQAAAANAAFLAYAPPPSGTAGAICLVDTGVTPNADTTNVVYATSVVEGGSEDVAPNHHGTLMTMFASAPGPVDGKGMTGFWPRAKVVSIRAAPTPPPGAEGDISINDYVVGAERCMSYAATYDIKAINLSLGSTQQFTANEQLLLENMIQEAHDFGINIAAAAGNEAETEIDWPARATGIFAVGGFNAATGAKCPNSNTGPQLAIQAPGCQLDFAEPLTLEPFCCDGGTSQATVIVSATIAGMRSYDPSLTWQQAQDALTSTASHGNLDVAAAFDAVGLESVVAAGEAAEPKPAPQAQTGGNSNPTVTATTTTTSTSRASSTTGSSRRPAAPKVRHVSWRHGALTVDLAPLTHGADVRAVLVYGQLETRTLTIHGDRMVLHVGRPIRLELTTIVHGGTSRPRVVLRF